MFYDSPPPLKSVFENVGLGLTEQRSETNVAMLPRALDNGLKSQALFENFSKTGCEFLYPLSVNFR